MPLLGLRSMEECLEQIGKERCKDLALDGKVELTLQN